MQKRGKVVTNSENIRIIFGLKVRQLRKERAYSTQQLSKLTGISVSYLNEIEKGKKYPSTKKIIQLGEAFGVSYEDMVSLKLERQLEPVVELLNTNLLQEIPLEMFGIGLDKLVEIIASAPAKVSAFISTLLQIARNYEMHVEQFYFSALRSYQELHDNYFEDLETAVDSFCASHQLDNQPPIAIEYLYDILEKKFNYQFDETKLNTYKELTAVRSIYVQKGKQQNLLLLNSNLSDAQKSFQLAKELGYQHLKLKERTDAPTWLKRYTFEKILNNYKASYFAGALLINKKNINKELKNIFQAKKWSNEQFLQLMQSYNVSPETFMHRLTNILPRYFNLKQLFFLRFSKTKDNQKYQITKELHLSQQHNPHGNEINEHYCRRWISINIIKELTKQQANNTYQNPLVRVQRSQYMDSGKEYFCISVARPMAPTPDTSSSVTIGFEMTREFKRKAKFWKDPNISIRKVNETCERCSLQSCKERVAPPSVLEKKEENRHVKGVLKKIIDDI